MKNIYRVGLCVVPVRAQKVHRHYVTGPALFKYLEIQRVPTENTGTIPGIDTIQPEPNRDPLCIMLYRVRDNTALLVRLHKQEVVYG